MNEQLKAFAAATNNELFDADYKGGEWMVESVQTRDTLDQFVAARPDWNECGTMERGEIAGFPFIVFKNAQPLKGQPRVTKSVVDFGEFRFAIETNLTNF